MKEKIKNILQGLRPEFDFNTDADFIAEGMIDSFDMVNLVSELEENFDIIIDGIDILPENFSSLDAIEALVNKSEKR